MHRQRPVARDYHDAFQHGLVVERARFGHDIDLGFRELGGNGLRDLGFDRGNAIERKRAVHPELKIGEQRGADGAHAHTVDTHDTGCTLGNPRDQRARPLGRGVGQRVDGAAAEPPARDQDDHRNDQRRNRVGPRIAERDADEPGEHRD